MNSKVVYILIAILLAVDNIFIRFRLGGIVSIDRVLEFMLFFILLKPYLIALQTNSFFRNWNSFLVAFAVLQFLVNLRFLVMGEIGSLMVLIDLFKGLSFIVYSSLFFLLAQKNLRYVKIILMCHFIICLFSLLQHPLSPIAGEMLEIKKILFSSATDEGIVGALENEIAYISGGHADRFRMAGPFANTISFSYFAITSFCLAFFMYVKTRKNFYMIVLGTVFICSILSQTRSLLLGELIIIFGYLFLSPQKKRPLYQLGIVFSGVVLALFVAFGQNYLIPQNSRLTTTSSEGRSDSRPLLWLTGISAAVNYPLGVSKKEYKSVKKEMYAKYGKTSILHLTSHNGIINIGIYYSILGYLLLFLFVKFLLMHNKNSNRQMRYFFALCLMGYAIHVSFHNNIILSADYPYLMVLILIGLESQNFKPITKKSFEEPVSNSNRITAN